MWLVGSRHGKGAALVAQPVIGFVLDGLVPVFLQHTFLEAPTLDHEVLDDTMKDGAVVVTFSDITQKVLHRDRGVFREQFDDDVSPIRRECDVRVGVRDRGVGE